jgi:hypothetical protein
MRIVAVLAGLAALGGCASGPTEDLLASTEVVRMLAPELGAEVPVARFSRATEGGPLPEGWEPYVILPSKPRTQYRLARADGVVALEARADASASGKIRRIRIEPVRHPLLEWRWRVDGLIPGADKRRASAEDSPARLIVSFHGDADKLDFEARSQLRLAKAFSGRALPYATLMYVWSSALPVGTVLHNPHTSRVRMIVVASGSEGLGRWQTYRRNILEDYRRAFGEEPDDIVAVGVMTDADNTRQKARSFYCDISFLQKL